MDRHGCAWMCMDRHGQPHRNNKRKAAGVRNSSLSAACFLSVYLQFLHGSRANASPWQVRGYSVEDMTLWRDSIMALWRDGVMA